MGILEKIAEIEKEMARTQKNKGITNNTLRELLSQNGLPAYRPILKTAPPDSHQMAKV